LSHAIAEKLGLWQLTYKYLVNKQILFSCAIMIIEMLNCFYSQDFKVCAAYTDFDIQEFHWLPNRSRQTDPKMKILPSFPQPGVIPDLYDFLYSAEDIFFGIV